ncbi:hypothetical protein K491DRAFT_696334 [Lophiostoma macrostomum CBS 122681]|uniref:HCP-like protein n=1 Tax=Lophiostoma macrostomum CBS 122681 TaxID=1314788 RepID=A0A6A6SUZ5_9PLEO|nr:hypothetical protein K491DRAFT_696334 [Lophiostoma macrostomum CBS 122681]
MSRAPILRASKRILSSEPCIFCQLRQLPRGSSISTPFQPHLFRSATIDTRRSAPQKRNYATVRSSDTPQVFRKKRDDTNRVTYLRLSEIGKVLALDHKTAEAKIQEFLAKRDSMDEVALVRRIAKGSSLELITHLALVIARVPDIGPTDQSGRMPPSIHPELSRQLFMACIKAGERTAILHVLRAVMRRSESEVDRRRVSQFTSTDIRIARYQLEALAKAGDADAKTLLGQLVLLEDKVSKHAQTSKAYQLWQEAYDIKVANKTRKGIGYKEPHQLEMPQMEPWNLLGCAFLEQQDPTSREQAKALFATGALQADDPISYYYLASFEDPASGLWLQHMTKAASSGVADAMYELANFYNALGDPESSSKALLKTDSLLAKATYWVTSFRKKDGAKDHAIEWYKVAADAGSKPAMWKLAELAEACEDFNTAAENLEELVEAPVDDTPGGAELVRAASRKLQSPEYREKRGAAAAKRKAEEERDGFRRKKPGPEQRA